MASADLTQGDIAPILKRMTIPMIIGLIMMMSFNMVDTFFVSLLGTDPLAAISFTFPVTFTVVSLNIGLGIGTSAVIAHTLGAGQSATSRFIATSALMLTVVLVGTLSLLGYLLINPIFTALNAPPALFIHIHDYIGVWFLASVFLALPIVGNSVLRANGDTKTPSIIMATAGGINVVLDPILIFGWGPIPAYGIKGAAIATLFAWIICASWVIYLLAIKRNLMIPRLLKPREFIDNAQQILRIGLPAAGANMLTPVAGGVVTAIIASYGPSAVAAWGVGNRIESLASIVVLALSMTLPPFISQNAGAGKFTRVGHAYRTALQFVMLWQVGIYAILAVTSSFIATAFSSDPEVQRVIILFLMIVPLGYGLQGVVILSNSSLNAIHCPMSALWLSVIRLFVLLVPLVYLGSYLFDVVGLLAATVIANLLMAIIAFTWFRHRLRQQSVVSSNAG